MKNLIPALVSIAAICSPLDSIAATVNCAAPTTNLRSIIPPQWIIPGNYQVWNTDCAHYVFNYVTRPTDASYYAPDTGHFFNYGFATNTITELDEDNNNATVAAQINAWSFVKSGVHKLFGAAIQTVDTAEGNALTTIVATESQVNSRNAENPAPKVGIDTVLITAHGSDSDDIGADKYNLNSWAHFISASAPRKGEHAGWEKGIHVSRYGLGTSINRNFKTMIDLEQIPDSVCLATFTRKNGKTVCLRYTINKDRMEIVGDIHSNAEVKVFQTFSTN